MVIPSEADLLASEAAFLHEAEQAKQEIAARKEAEKFSVQLKSRALKLRQQARQGTGTKRNVITADTRANARRSTPWRNN